MIYFASDIHLGGGDRATALATEQRFCSWLDRIAPSVEVLVLAGDIFDFWFEYKRVVPKGFVRTLARLTAMSDRGVRVIFFIGNHDMWIREYLHEECGMEIYLSPQRLTLGGKRVHIAHGDNLKVINDPWLKLMNTTFRSKIVRRLFSALVHPDAALKFGHWWSNSSRKKHLDNNFKNREMQLASLIDYAMERQAEQPCDYYIFGHLHIEHLEEREGVKIIFLNDWSSAPYYAVMDSKGEIKLEQV